MATIPAIFPQDEEGDISEEFVNPDDDLGLTDSELDEVIPYGFTWRYDFNAEDLDFSAGNPPIARGLDTVHEWISHTLNTEQNETPIFSGAIGTNIFSLIGSPLDSYVMTRVEDEIRTAIAEHDRITEVGFISTFTVKGNMYTYFLYETDDTIIGQELQQLG